MSNETYIPWDDVLLGEWNSWHKLGDAPVSMSQMIETYNTRVPGEYSSITGCIGVAAPREQQTIRFDFHVQSYAEAVEMMRNLNVFADGLKHFAGDFLEHAKSIKEQKEVE